MILPAALLAMLLVATVAPAQEPEDEVRCLLPEGCDMNGDGVPALRAGEPVPDVETNPGAVQYDNAL